MARRVGTAVVGLRDLIVAVGLVLVLAALVAWLVPGALGDRPATCRDTRCFCEAVGTGLLAQPADSLSSLAFCLVAVVVAGRGRRVPRHTPERALVPALVATLLALGAGSLAYHARLSYAGQLLDIQGMYVLGILLVAGAGWRAGWLTPRSALLTAAGLLIALAAAQWAWPDLRRVLFAAVLIPGIALEARLSPRSRPLRVGVALLAGGYAAWLADERGWWCDPTSPVQGHALWHVLTALAAGLLVEHYRRTAARAT